MQSIFCNNKEITEIRCNGSLVYQKQSGPDYTEPFYVENITNENERMYIMKRANAAPTLTIEYSTDKENWSTLGTTSATIPLIYSLEPGSKVYLRCNTNTWCSTGSNFNYIINVSKVGGNIMSLLYGSNFTGNEISFPDTTVSNVFADIFYTNTVLIDATDLLLPATTLIRTCYYHMFNGCTSLTSAPALPATTLADYCYYSMFNSCTSLITAPALPATTLAPNCYGVMFFGCTSLTTAPELHATTLTSSCYAQMFQNCSSLSNVKCLATSGINTSVTSSWLMDVSSTGTFTKAAGATWPSGRDGIPEGWTVVEV